MDLQTESFSPLSDQPEIKQLLEKQYSYSKYYLERQFKKAYGISLIAYRNEKRMQHARKLLELESVSDVAEELGFRSIYSFSRAFKKQFGICPSECRKK